MKPDPQSFDPTAHEKKIRKASSLAIADAIKEIKEDVDVEENEDLTEEKGSSQQQDKLNLPEAKPFRVHVSATHA